MTQSPPSLQLVPFKFEMSSEAEEMSSKPSYRTDARLRRQPEGGGYHAGAVWSRSRGYVARKAQRPGLKLTPTLLFHGISNESLVFSGPTIHSPVNRENTGF